MPDFRGQDTHQWRLNAVQKRLWRSKLLRFSRLVQKRARGAGPLKLKQKYLPNNWHAKALDQTLKSGTGLCLADFTHTPVTRALVEGERRYTVEASKLPEALRANMQGRVKRVLVTMNGKKRLEMCPAKQRRVLHMHIDQGPENCVYRFWMLQCRGLIGWIHPDTLHRQHNNFMQAAKDAGLQWALRDMTLMGAIGAAPWGQSGNYGKYLEAAKKHTSNFNEGDALYVSVYPWLA
eukprot:2202446-Amphidinium_carterae.1